MPDELASRLRAVIGRMGRGLRQTRGRNRSLAEPVRGVRERHFRERVRLSDLAEIEGLNPTLLSRIVGKLEEKELVAASRTPTIAASRT